MNKSNIFSQDTDMAVPVPLQDNALGFDKASGNINNLTRKTIKEISETGLFGKLVDMYFPDRILNCYVFIFKNDDSIFKIAANTEFNINNKIRLEEIELAHFIAIGQYAIDYSDGRKKKMFKSPSNTPFDLEGMVHQPLWGWQL